MDAMAQGADAVRDEKIIIKTQPPVGAAATATASAQAPRDADGQADWAICCSGGGIRSATYCLGALQRLDQGGLVGRAGWILGVSGGSYIAASRALVAHDLEQRNAEDRRADDRHAYARGTPEEQNLRDNTRYIAPDAKTALVAILSLLLGATVTFLLAIAPVYAFGHALPAQQPAPGVATRKGVGVGHGRDLVACPGHRCGDYGRIVRLLVGDTVIGLSLARNAARTMGWLGGGHRGRHGPGHARRTAADQLAVPQHRADRHDRKVLWLRRDRHVVTSGTDRRGHGYGGGGTDLPEPAREAQRSGPRRRRIRGRVRQVLGHGARPANPLVR